MGGKGERAGENEPQPWPRPAMRPGPWAPLCGVMVSQLVIVPCSKSWEQAVGAGPATWGSLELPATKVVQGLVGREVGERGAPGVGRGP